MLRRYPALALCTHATPQRSLLAQRSSFRWVVESTAAGGRHAKLMDEGHLSSANALAKQDVASAAAPSSTAPGAAAAVTSLDDAERMDRVPLTVATSFFSGNGSLTQRPLFGNIKKFSQRTRVQAAVGAYETNQLAGSPFGQLHRQQDVARQTNARDALRVSVSKVSWQYAVPLVVSAAESVARAANEAERAAAQKLFAMVLQRHLNLLALSLHSSASLGLMVSFLRAHTDAHVHEPLSATHGALIEQVVARAERTVEECEAVLLTSNPIDPVDRDPLENRGVSKKSGGGNSWSILDHDPLPTRSNDEGNSSSTVAHSTSSPTSSSAGPLPGSAASALGDLTHKFAKEIAAFKDRFKMTPPRR